MKIVSDTFKKDLEFYGKQIISRIFIGSDLIEKKNINKINRYFEGDILKSVMRQCDIELDGIYNYEVGTKVDQVYFGVKGTAEEYEYISWNEWIIDKIEHSEDEQTTKLYCYDKMLYSMINYDLEVEYPITLGNYLEKICERLGLPLYSKSFVNSDIEIEEEKYLGLGYTYRDVLTEIAQASAGTIAINDLGMLEVMYPKSTGEQIKGDKEGNTSKLTIGKKIGPINSIVIARTPQEDNIYIKDDESIVENGLFEIKIENNQIMDSHREDFKEGIFNKLNGLTYYTYELESYGICYLDLMDMFELKGKDDNYYPALMLNDNIEITQDLWETSNCEEPVITETDYSTASESDKTMLRTISRVNKQEGKITQLVEETNQNAYKIAQVTQTVNEIKSEISEVADITISADGYENVSLANINQSEPIYLKIYPTNNQDISYLYPSDDLFPSDDLYPQGRTIRFATNDYYIDYELPCDLLYYDENNYDEFILDYDSQSCVVNKRVGYSDDGSKCILENPQTIEYPYPTINLNIGDYTVTVLGYENAYLFVRMMVQNMYTDQFATKMEMNSAITQTAENIKSEVSRTYATQDSVNSSIEQKAEEINSEVRKKVGNDEIISKINQTAEEIKILASKLGLSANDVLSIIAGNTIDLTSKNITITSDNFSVDKNGKIKTTSGEIGGFTLGEKSFVADIYTDYDYTENDRTTVMNIIMNNTTPSTEQLKKYDLNGDGIITSGDYVLLYRILQSGVTTTNPAKLIFNTDKANFTIELYDGNGTRTTFIDTFNSYFNKLLVDDLTVAGSSVVKSDSITSLTEKDTYLEAMTTSGAAKGITWWDSDRKLKENIIDSNINALDVIKNIKHREYDRIDREEHSKLGYVAQELQEVDENFVFEVKQPDGTSILNINQPNLIPYLTKAIQEQQEMIEQLKEEIMALKNEK